MTRMLLVLFAAAAWSLRGAAAYVFRTGAFDLASLSRALPVAAAVGVFLWAARRAKPPEAAGILAFALLNALLLALAPPTEWDVLAYHLALPKLYLAAGRVYELPWLFHSHYPHLIELAYAPLLRVSDALPAIVHAALCAAWIGSVFATARKRLGERAAWIAAALCAAQPVVLRFSGVAHSDGALALFHWLACAALWDGRFALAGLWSGLAASCKLSGMIAATALFLVAWRRGGARAAAAFAAPAALAVAPWLVKNWVWAGNPVWPFFPSLLGGKWGAAGLAAGLLASARSPRPVVDLLAAAPPLFWAALAAAALGRPRRVPAWLFAPGAALLAALWSNNEAWRYLWPAYPPLALYAADALGPWSLAAAAGMVLAPCANPAFGALALKPSTGGSDRRAAYLTRALDHFAFYREVNARLAGTGAKLLLFREIRGYYLDVPYMWGDPVDQGLIRYAELRDPAALLDKLRELGVTHVLVNEGLGIYAPGVRYYDARTVGLMDSALAGGRLVLKSGGLSLFELPPRAL